MQKKNTRKPKQTELNTPPELSGKNTASYIHPDFKDLLHSKWAAALAGLFILTIIFAIRKIANYDIGFHLAAGRWIIENFTVPYTDIFTYSVPHNEYIDIQWFYQVINFTFYSIGGYPALTILNVILISTVFLLILYRLNSNGVHIFISLAVLFAALFVIQARFSYRPEVFTWIFILLTIFVLDKHYRGLKVSLFWLPVIMLFWVNMHGLFILGYGIMGAYLISGYIKSKKLDKQLLQWFGISLVAALVNPYHINGALFPFYLFTRLQADNIFQQSIIELKKPWGMIAGLEGELYAYFIFSVVSIILVLLTIKKRKVHELIIFAAFFYLSYSAYRNIPIFIIYAAFLAGVCLSDMFNQTKSPALFAKLRPLGKILSIIVAVAALLTAARVISGAYYLSNNSMIKFGFGIDNTILPDQTADFIHNAGLKGKILNRLDAGGWFEWKLRQPTYIDGRLEVIREGLFSEYMNGLKVYGVKMLIEKYQPEIIISDAGVSAWDADLTQMGGWKLVHFDQVSTVYVKDGFGGNLNFDMTEGLKEAGITSVIQKEEVPALFSNSGLYSTSDWMQGFVQKQTVPTQLIRMGNFTFDNARPEIAESFYLEFIKQSGAMHNKDLYYELYFNLGSIYHAGGNTDLAMMCYNNCLKIYPYNSEVLARITDIKNHPK